MIGKTNVGGGGSGGAYAYVKAVYPSGSVCTATNGTKTITAEDTTGEYVFNIPEPSSTPESWTVGCTDGTSDDSKIVSVSAKYQIDTIMLTYGVPPEYVQCSYLYTGYGQNTAQGAYIDTGLGPMSFNEEITLEYDINSSYGSVGSVIGYCSTDGRNRFGIVGGSFYLNGNTVGSGSYPVYTSGYGKEKIIINDDDNLIMYYAGNSSTGTSIARVTDPVESQSDITSNIYLFGIYNSSNDYSYASAGAYIYSYKRKNKTTGLLVQDFVPCYRVSDTVPGFYDLVNRAFHPAVNSTTQSIRASSS